MGFFGPSFISLTFAYLSMRTFPVSLQKQEECDCMFRTVVEMAPSYCSSPDLYPGVFLSLEQWAKTVTALTNRTWKG